MSAVLPHLEITPDTPLAGWGARIRTREWRNQNPQKAIDIKGDSAPMFHLCRIQPAECDGATNPRPFSPPTTVAFPRISSLDRTPADETIATSVRAQG